LQARTTLLPMRQNGKVTNQPGKPPGMKKRSRFKLRYLGVALVAGWAAYEFWHVQAPQLADLNQQHAQLQSQLSELERQQNTLNNQVHELQSDAYIAKYATSHYNLILPGQVPFDLGH
jgi:cell division protein FtsB